MKIRYFLVCLLALLFCGCASQPLKIPTVVANKPYETIGPAEGGATGLMLFNFIPIGQNERFVNAYNAALRSKNADALLDPEISENWFWGYILNGYSTKIQGTAIKYK